MTIISSVGIVDPEFTLMKENLGDWEPVTNLVMNSDSDDYSTSMSGDGLTIAVNVKSPQVHPKGLGTYVYRSVGVMWELSCEILPDRVITDTVVVINHDGSALVQSDVTEDSGAVTIFTLSDGEVTGDITVERSGLGKSGSFGTSLAISDAGVLLAISDTSVPIATNACEGYVHLFHSGMDWACVGELYLRDRPNVKNFGLSLTMSGDGALLLVETEDTTRSTTHNVMYVFNFTSSQTDPVKDFLVPKESLRTKQTIDSNDKILTRNGIEYAIDVNIKTTVLI